MGVNVIGERVSRVRMAAGLQGKALAETVGISERGGRGHGSVRRLLRCWCGFPVSRV